MWLSSHETLSYSICTRVLQRKEQKTVSVHLVHYKQLPQLHYNSMCVSEPEEENKAEHNTSTLLKSVL